jgi:integrase/recombinase XerC
VSGELSGASPLRADLDEFLEYLRSVRRLSPHTVDAYRRDLGKLVDYCAEHGLGRLDELRDGDLRACSARLHRRGLSARSLHRFLSATRSWFDHRIARGELQHNPARGIQAPKAPRRLPKALGADQVSRLLHVETDDSLLLRDRAMLELMYSCGLRLSELVSVNLVDLDLRAGLLQVTGKGSKTRQVPVGRKARDAVRAWLGTRRELAVETEPALFVGRGGRRLGQRAVQQRFRRYAGQAGLEVPLHPHMLRHSFASHLLQSSGDLRAVQELLGHANIGTTQVYTHLDFQHLAKIYDASHPRAGRKKD